MNADSPREADWTRGGASLSFASCRPCGHVQYFRRPFCPRCGATELEARIASGRGTIYALTTVMRAPSAELRTHVPYRVALVDAEEGFRFMAHAAQGLAIGDAVRTTFRSFGATTVPFVEPQGRS